jgi:hypothetical protein
VILTENAFSEIRGWEPLTNQLCGIWCGIRKVEEFAPVINKKSWIKPDF